MSKKDKLIEKLKSKPKDFTYNELKVLLEKLGFIENNKGKTSGSGVEFYNEKLNQIIKIHKPHPQNIIKEYVIKYVLDRLKKIGVIKDE